MVPFWHLRWLYLQVTDAFEAYTGGIITKDSGSVLGGHVVSISGSCAHSTSPPPPLLFSLWILLPSTVYPFLRVP